MILGTNTSVAQGDADNFYKSNSVNTEKVSFSNQYKMKVGARLFLPKELEEAAKIDGCNTLKTLWYVIVPMLKPSLVSCALFQFMWTNNDFQGPLIYIADMQKYTNSVYLRMSMDGDVGFQWNRILAMSLISIVPSLIVFFLSLIHI